MHSKVDQLVAQAKSIISTEHPGKSALWRAYMSIEYAILDLKLRNKLEGMVPPEKLSKKKAIDIALARSLLERIDLRSDEKKLLYDLRACRDVLKALVASYDRRSTTS